MICILTFQKLLQKNCNLNEKISCLEAVNAEQAQQIKNEIQNMMSVIVTEHNCEFLSNAQAICDKLNYKKEVILLLSYLYVFNKKSINNVLILQYLLTFFLDIILYVFLLNF